LLGEEAGTLFEGDDPPGWVLCVAGDLEPDVRLPGFLGERREQQVGAEVARPAVESQGQADGVGGAGDEAQGRRRCALHDTSQAPIEVSQVGAQPRLCVWQSKRLMKLASICRSSSPGAE
jgi:hypothetical protein